MATSTDLGFHRTFLAHDRTLMAWIRTSLSLISFGFTIDKFFDYLIQAEHLPVPRSLLGPRRFAMGMIGIGVIALVAATVQYRHTIRTLNQDWGYQYRSLTATFAVVVSIVGLVLLAIVLFRL